MDGSIVGGRIGGRMSGCLVVDGRQMSDSCSESGRQKKMSMPSTSTAW